MRRSGPAPFVTPSAAAAAIALLFVAGTARAGSHGAGASGAGSPGRPAVTATAAFDRLKALAGTWQGTADAEMGGEVTVIYRVISAGTAILETLFPGTDHEMVSLYSVEGEELRMVHYCAYGNQPHFRLDRTASTADDLRFVLDGGVGFNPKTDAHVHAGRIALRGGEGIEATWEYYEAGKSRGARSVSLQRATSASATAMR